MELVDLIEAITYIVCKDSPVIFESFFKVFSENKVLTSKLMGVFSSSDALEIKDLMEFIMQATVNQGLKLSKEYENRVRQVFEENLGGNKQSMNFEEFKRCIAKGAFKEDFFVKRMFDIFDTDNTGKFLWPSSSSQLSSLPRMTTIQRFHSFSSCMTKRTKESSMRAIFMKY